MKLVDVHRISDEAWRVSLVSRFLWVYPMRTEWVGTLDEHDNIIWTDAGTSAKPAPAVLAMYLTKAFTELQQQRPW